MESSSELPLIGTGLDLVECRRIAESRERFGDRFLNRIFLPDEIKYCLAQKYPERHLAARFAAKEALSKAFGTGIGKEVGWKDMEIYRDDLGAPHVRFHGKAQALAHKKGVAHAFVSLTHTDDYAAASAHLVRS
jgi:holo-[acyl-carrier protein] synthase